MSIETCWDNARTSSGNAPWRKFNQGAKIADQALAGNLDAADVNGLCGGVSVLYLGLKKAGKSLFTEEQGRTNAVWKYIKRGFQETCHATMEACKFEMVGEAMGLKTHARSIVFTCPVTRAGIPGWVQKNQGYFLIGTPNHYCAATNAGSEFSVFDPNTGEVFFPAAHSAHFANFFFAYFNAPEVAELYRLVAGQKVYLTWYK